MPAPATTHVRKSKSHSSPRRSPARRRPPTAKSPRRPSLASELEAALDAAQRIPTPNATTFTALGLPKPLVLALSKKGIDAPFAIQARAIPDVLAGRDVLGRAQTGGGKTLAFGLPMLARLASSGSTSSGSKRTPKAPRALVLVPTRELATQVADELRPLGESLALKLACVFGGASYGKQIDALNRGVDVVVATPGRLIDLIERRACTLSAVEISVLDEADHMADLGFLPAVTRLLDQTAPDGQRMLFSATLDRGVDTLVRAYLADPALHAVAAAAAPIEAMDHQVFVLRAEDKVAVMAEVAARPARTLIFVRTRHGVDRLAKQLRQAGVEAGAIHGDIKQNARQRALDAFAAGHPRVLVATDVAARGIHVDDVDLVVHFDPPNDAKDYLHRSGRTARAGATGTALMLVLPEQIAAVAALHRGAGVSPVAVDVHPSHAAVRKLARSGEPVRVATAPNADTPKRGTSNAGSSKLVRQRGRRSGGTREPREDREPRFAREPRASREPRAARATEDARRPNAPRGARERFDSNAVRARKPRHRQMRAQSRPSA